MIEILETLRTKLEEVRVSNQRKLLAETDLSGIGPMAKKQGRVLGVEDSMREVDKLILRMRDGEEVEDELT